MCWGSLNEGAHMCHADLYKSSQYHNFDGETTGFAMPIHIN
jgi:hypothetical protein